MTCSLPIRAAAGCLAAAIAGFAGCGGDEPRPDPSQRDVQAIAAATSDVVLQCSSVEAGFAAEADVAALRRDVDVLLDAWERVRPEAPFTLPASGLERRTSLREQVRLAMRELQDGCAPRQAERLRDVLDGG